MNLQGLADPIEMTSPQGRLVLHIMGALAEFEGVLVIERTLGVGKSTLYRHLQGGQLVGAR